MRRQSKKIEEINSDWLSCGNALIQRMKMQFSCFLFCQVVQKHKLFSAVKRLLIAYFIGNISAKNIKIHSHV